MIIYTLFHWNNQELRLEEMEMQLLENPHKVLILF